MRKLSTILMSALVLWIVPAPAGARAEAPLILHEMLGKRFGDRAVGAQGRAVVV